MDNQEIVNILKDGKLAITPSDTVYGIIGDATNINVIHEVYKIKKRPYTKPLIIMVSSMEMLKEYIKEISPLEQELINNYWPGPLTILLTKNEKISNFITNNSPLVGVRYPNNQDLIEIMNKLGKPIFSTSANITGTETITNVKMLENEMIQQIPYIYDAGEIINPPSTIVKVEENKVIILREGTLASALKAKYQK